MALPPPKTPPRFVPTLTEVVQVPDPAPLPPASSAPLRTTVMSPSALPAARPSPTAAQPATRPLSPPLPSARPPAVMAPRPAAPAPVQSAPAPLVHHAPVAAVAAPASSSSPASLASTLGPSKTPRPQLTRPLPEGMEEYMVHRVMQRVDVVLDQRLREAIATVVQEQTRSVLPRLREEIESVVRHAVYEAVADELASGAASVPKG
ncbi:hypothetical protein KW832_10120 [Acidovorax sp. sif0632]|nr:MULTISPECIES: hypothetical protein [unclassified Acidovorax]MBV7460066.1 hypothetical protein [Acidovorax sp. sif0632]MBV7465091.1 hypothetical protein [Acidovorax sp. sif0613]